MLTSAVALEYLATSPVHQRKGVASMLISSGIKVADEAGLPCIVDATMAGRGVYLKHGFEVRHTDVQDEKDLGESNPQAMTILVRSYRGDS